MEAAWQTIRETTASDYFMPLDTDGTVVDVLNPLEWAYSRRRIEGKPFTLENHKPLRQCYEDNHPFQVFIKPAQVGVSEMAVCKTGHALEVGAQFWNTGKEGLNVGYLFPTQAALIDFSRERISVLSEESDQLSATFGNAKHNAVTFKQIGKSYLYLRGAWNKKALKAFAADIIILDEYDEMAPDAVALAEKRMRASNVRRQICISTPTIPGQGIHALYLQSDQKVWKIPCLTCGEWIELDFFRDVWANGKDDYSTWQDWTEEQVMAATWDTHCPNCKQAIDRFADGEWIAKYPHRQVISGYHIPALCFPVVSLPNIIMPLVSRNPTRIQEAYRSDLGLPYEPSGSRVTTTMLDLLSTDLEHGRLPRHAIWKRVTMGVDVGLRLHYRISAELERGGERYVIAMGHVDDWDDLSMLMREHKVRLCVIDANPETHKCKEWQKLHRSKVLRAFYPNGMAGNLWREKENEGVIQINRTMAMDAVFAAVSGGDEHWPDSIINDPEVRAHMVAPMRTRNKDLHGAEVVSWIHTAPDHLYHACVYDFVANEALPKRKFGSILAQGKTKGWRNEYNS